MNRLAPCLLALTLGGPLLAGPLACLWDYDTLQQEQARFPETLELLTGHFPRHSQAYYRWRIADREARRASGEEGAALYDDLAVAWSKLGEDAQAIELMAQKEQRYPGLYETAANLGTFHIHAGDFEEGAKHVARAIEINPEAHFGREIYQELLVRYVIEQRAREDAPALPLEDAGTGFFSDGGKRGFWNFVRDQRKTTKEGESAEIARAVKGVQGMQRFGNWDSPVLCEALSDLLLAGRNDDAKNLAARALLQASYRVDDDTTRAKYRNKAQAALSMQTPSPREYRSVELKEIEAQFEQELATAAAWYAELEAKEARWIEAGEDVDARFAETYYGADGKPQPLPSEPPISKQTQVMALVGLGALGLGLVMAIKRR